jgi:hypothetical protein
MQIGVDNVSVVHLCQRIVNKCRHGLMGIFTKSAELRTGVAPGESLPRIPIAAKTLFQRNIQSRGVPLDERILPNIEVT